MPQTEKKTKNLIAFAGGGSAGHVTPNLPLIAHMQDAGKDVIYFGTPNGIEREIIEDANIPYRAVPSGKLRRYFSVQNFLDPFIIVWGIVVATFAMLRKRPYLLFSKGGFAAVPPVIAAWLLRIPVVIHESDRTPGLTNKICSRFAKRICVSYEDSPILGDPRVVLTGSPVRESLFHGMQDKGLALTGFTGDRPVLLCFGGSLGAKAINQALRDGLDDLTARFDVIHVAGAGNLDPSLTGRAHYWQAEFVRDEFADLLALADIAISRAGANAIAELGALRIPALLIPLPLDQSRGDQIENAALAKAQGTSHVMMEADMTASSLVAAVAELYDDADNLRTKLEGQLFDRGGAEVLSVIADVAN